MNLDERLDYFEEHYDIIAGHHLGSGPKIYVGSSQKVCRFCGKSEPDVTFRTVAHAVPEFLGNKQLVLRNECDVCNTFVSNNLENHLDKYTKPFRLAAQIKGKKKVPNYRTNDKRSRFEFDVAAGAKVIDPVDSGFSLLDVESKELTANFHLEPYIPTAVYKCLVKIALSVIEEEELIAFKSTVAWIMDPNHSFAIINPQILLSAFVPGPRPNRLMTVLVLRRKAESNVVPYCLCVVAFGNLSYQIIVPSDIDISAGSSTVKLIRFPIPFESDWEFGSPRFGQADLTSNEIVKGAMLPITFTFDEAQKLDPSTVHLEASKQS